MLVVKGALSKIWDAMFRERGIGAGYSKKGTLCYGGAFGKRKPYTHYRYLGKTEERYKNSQNSMTQQKITVGR